MRSPLVCLITALTICCSFAGAENFVVPSSGQIYLEAITAKTGAEWKFGIGTTPENCKVYLSSLPDTSYPRGESPTEPLNAGETVRFCMWSKFGTRTAWAFSDGSDQASLVAFGDAKNALGMGANV